LKIKKNDSPEFHEIIFRISDNGFAYRYNFSSDAINDSIFIKEELTELNCKDDFKYWAYNRENHNVGPIVRSEQLIKKVETPIVMQFNKNSFMAIHEAAILDFAPFSINAAKNNQSLAFNINYSKRDQAFNTSWSIPNNKWKGEYFKYQGSAD
jgi:alpha-glucosidase